MGADATELGPLAETAVFSQYLHDEDAHLFYSRWKKGEVDMVRLNAAQKPVWAIEVKWSDRYPSRPARTHLSRELLPCQWSDPGLGHLSDHQKNGCQREESICTSSQSASFVTLLATTSSTTNASPVASHSSMRLLQSVLVSGASSLSFRASAHILPGSSSATSF